MVSMVRTQIQLTEEQVGRLKSLSADRGISISELIRQAVDRLLSTGETPSGRRERAISSIGGFRSGFRDISEKHDEHLADAYDE